MTSTRFPRTARVRARSDFDRIFKHGRRVALPMLALHWQFAAATAGAPATTDSTIRQADATRPAGARLGLAVSRKVDPHAVGRNRIKRALREIFRRHRDGLRAGDYVVVARRGATGCGNAQLQQALLGLLRRADALPPPCAPVTMPSASAVSSASTDPDTGLARD